MSSINLYKIDDAKERKTCCINTKLKMNIGCLFESNWKQLDNSKKISILQELESMMALVQKRSVRSVVETTDDKDCAPYAEAQYNFSKPDKIFIRNIASGFDSALSIIHEGIHAMYDDAFKGINPTVYTFGNVNAKALLKERAEKSIIFNHFKHKPGNCSVIFNLCYIEEKIAHYDSKCFLLNIIEEYARSQPGIFKNNEQNRLLFGFYEKIFVKELERIKYINDLEMRNNTNYGVELKKIDYELFENKRESYKKPIIVVFASSIPGHFSSQLQILKNIHNPSMINKRDVNIKKFRVNYESYFK